LDLNALSAAQDLAAAARALAMAAENAAAAFAAAVAARAGSTAPEASEAHAQLPASAGHMPTVPSEEAMIADLAEGSSSAHEKKGAKDTMITKK